MKAKELLEIVQEIIRDYGNNAEFLIELTDGVYIDFEQNSGKVKKYKSSSEIEIYLQNNSKPDKKTKEVFILKAIE